MPPTSVRKASVATTDTNPGRRQSGRQPRTTTSRPINYYARTFGSISHPQDDGPDQDPPGFFPAVQYFADSTAALPREVQRHITLMKEVEAKVYGPTEALKTLSTHIMSLPVPPPRNQPSSPRLLTFTASNSTTNSLNGSVLNGVHPTIDQLASDAAESQQDEQADHARRAEFHKLRHLLGNMIANLDEKNVVMAEANRALQHQLGRLDAVIPHIENEISEESRLGSLTHWAYAENRTKKQPASSQHDRARRDVAATSSLAAAAQAVHEGDIAAARGEARREAKKTNRGHQADSDFDDRPTKRAQTGKARKAAEVAQEQKATAGLGIANGTTAAAPAKRRKVEKGPTAAAVAAAAAGAPAMERSASNLSAVGKTGRGGANTTPRSTPTVEAPVKRKGKPGPAPGSAAAAKKRNPALNQGTNSPKLTSSPVLGVAQLHQEAPTSRPASSRMRQNSTSNLQHSLLPEKETSRPASVQDNKSVSGSTTGPVDSGAPSNASAKETKNGTEEVDSDRMQIDEPIQESRPARAEKQQQMKNEVASIEEVGPEKPISRGRRTSKVSTPRTENLSADTGMLRTRSHRGNGSTTRGSNTPTDSGSGHHDRRRGRRKSGSGAHILKQIASFNRSPDTDRHRDTSKGSDGSDNDHDDDDEEDGRSRPRSHPPRVTTISRGRRGNGSRATTSSRRTEQPSPEPEEDAGDVADEEEEEEAEDGEDPNEPKYCYCGQGSFGEMIACDNDDCPMEWFHLGCTGLRAVPGDNVKWYCDVCEKAMQQPQRGKKARPGGRL